MQTVERVWSSELASHAGNRVVLKGWLHRFRVLSQVSFLIIRDRSGIAQIVLVDPDEIDRLSQLGNESVLEVEGTVVAEPNAPGGVELHDPSIQVLVAVEDQLPFDLYRPEINARLPTILDHAPVALRHPRHRALHALSAALTAGFRTTLDAMQFTEIHTPKIVAAATESGANVFELDYFGQPAYLAQSPQFYKQIMVGVFERVYEVGPVFRAEPHDTARHLNEYISLDACMGFIEDHFTVMAVLRDVIAGMSNALRCRAVAELDLLELAAPDVPATIPDIHFVDAMERISRETGEDRTGETDLSPADERWLGVWAQENYGSDFLYVTGYPMAKRPFYTHPDPDRPVYSNSFDLLFRGLELVTGGQRLHRYVDYLDACDRSGIDPEPIAGYLEAFKFGMPSHGGFAIGLERWVARLAGVQNVRETTLFPRTINRITP